ncbi:glycerate-and formate-dehydrogenase [Thozetella sp. PMI_491]|nr:glycerate-and formate-dehydrogenase [Thozetella sp. PMI_491]
MADAPVPIATKPRVLSLGKLNYADPAMLQNFESKVDLHVVQPSDRESTVKLIAETAKSQSPFDAVMILMGSGPYERFDEELLGPLVPGIKIAACVNAGYSEFDLNWFTSNKIYVTNTLHAVAEPTADMAMYLILAVLRDTYQKEKNVRMGGWRNATSPPRDPNGLTLGIVGMGKIGKHVARKAKVFGMKIQYYNRSRVPEEEEKALEAKYCSELKELLATSDVVSINCPLTDATRDMIGEAEIAVMKDGSFLVNTGRGPVVNEKALIQALWSGKIERAGLDVFDHEPKINPFFRASEKVIVQPHMGSWTDVAWKNAYHETMANIEALFFDGKPISPVNKF